MMPVSGVVSHNFFYNFFFILQKYLSLIQMVVESYSITLMKFTQEEKRYASNIIDNACLIQLT